MTTARFWHFHRDGWVKLTIRDDQILSFGYGGPTEEGWSRHDESLHIEGNAVICTMVSDGRDCDGRLTHISTVRCSLNELASLKCTLYDAPGLVPTWQEVSSRQHDEYAEAMGY